LIRLSTEKDLKAWAARLGHSGGFYWHWTSKGVWMFLTFLDEYGYPHCTIHAKPARLWGKPHCDDRNRALTPVTSRQYEGIDKLYGETEVKLDGVWSIIMAAGHRDADGFMFNPEERMLMDDWYETLPKREHRDY
jgi:hypothetical protein